MLSSFSSFLKRKKIHDFNLFCLIVLGVSFFFFFENNFLGLSFGHRLIALIFFFCRIFEKFRVWVLFFLGCDSFRSLKRDYDCGVI